MPEFIIKDLKLNTEDLIEFVIESYKGKVLTRKELSFLNFKLFFNEEKVQSEEDISFMKIKKQLDNYDFSQNKILFSTKEFLGQKYKFVKIPNIKDRYYIIFQFNNILFVRQSWNGKLSIPTEFFRRKNNELKILKILKKSYFNKSKNKFVNFNERKFLDLKRFLPKTIEVFDEKVVLIVQEFSINKLLISYDLKGNKGKIHKPLIMDRYIPLNLFVQFLGFYFGDGFKKNSMGIGGVNSESSVITWIDKFLHTYFDDEVFYRIVHGWKKLRPKEELRVKKYWNGLVKGNVDKLNYNKSNKNPKEFGSLRVYLRNIISRRIFNSLLNSFHEFIKRDSELSKFYLRGIGMSDMGISHKNGRLSCICVGHQEENKLLRKHYKDVLNSYGINTSLVYGPTYISVYGFKNWISFINDDIFRDHDDRKERFVKGILNLDKIGKMIRRLQLLQKPLTSEEFRTKIGISDDSYNQLSYLKKLDLIKEIPTYPKFYVLNSRGIGLLKNLNMI